MDAIGNQEKKFVLISVLTYSFVEMFENIFPGMFWRFMLRFLLIVLFGYYVIRSKGGEILAFARKHFYFKYYFVYLIYICIAGIILYHDYVNASYVANAMLPILFVSVYSFISSSVTGFTLLCRYIFIILFPLSLIKYLGDFSYLMTNFSGYISIVYLFILLIPFIGSFWKKIIIVVFSLLSFYYELNDRTNVMMISLSCLIMLFGRPIFKAGRKFKILLHSFIFLLPFFLLFLGIIGAFNIFELSSEFENVSNERESVSTVDTRTFLYYEVLSDPTPVSVVLGRSAAGRYDSSLAEVNGLAELQRDSTECGILNTYLKGGLLWVFLFAGILFTASRRALLSSHNVFCSNVSLLILAYWLMSFIEIQPGFENWFIVLFICVGICYNNEMALMNNKEIRIVVK